MDCSKFKIRDNDPFNRKITKIFYCSENYIVYETEKSAGIKYLTEKVKYDAIEIAIPIEQINDLATKRIKSKFKNRIANAYRNCFEGELDQAKNILDSIVNAIRKNKELDLKYSYLATCILLVLLNISLTIFLGFDFKVIEDIKHLFFLSTFGSIGGIISISLKIDKLKYDYYSGKWLYVVNAVFRIFIAMLSAIVIYFAVKSSIVFGFLNNTETIDSSMYILAVASGFSEYFIPNTLQLIEKKLNK